MFESQLLSGIKKDFGITTANHDKTIKALIKQYIKGEISKQGFLNILKSFSKERN